MSDRLRIQSSERVDLSDFQHVAAQSDADSKELHANVFADPAKTRTWILEGFAMTNPAAKQIQVALGRAILSQRVGGITQYGALTVAGDATKIVDLNAYTPGTYGVYVRFEEVESETAGRIFWDPAGAGSEYSQSIATRYVANWSVRVESSNPGTEWTKLGEVAQATMAITDQRNFYFEGQVDDTYESGWSTDGGGAANDRNADRQQYGCFDFQTFGSAMRQSLEDIKGRGLRRWWSSDIGGMNLGFDAAPVEDNLAIGDANFNFDLNTATPLINFDAGDGFSYNRSTNLLSLQFGSTAKYNLDATTWYPETDDSVDLGIVATNRFKDLFLSGNASIANLLPIAASTYDLGAVANQFKDLFLSGNATIPGTAHITRLDISSTPTEGVSNSLVPATADTYAVGSVDYPWATGHFSGLKLYNAGSGVDRKWSRVYAAADSLVIAGINDALATKEYLTFTKNAAGTLNELIIGTAADTPIVRPSTDLLVTLGTASYRFGASYASLWQMNKLELKYTATYGVPAVDFDYEDAGLNCGLWQLWASQHVFALNSYLYDNPAFSYTPLSFELDIAGGLPYKVKDITIQCLDNVKLDEGNFAIAYGSGSGGIASYITYTGEAAVRGGSVVRTVQGTSSITNTGYISIYVGTTKMYMPYYTAN